MSELQQTRYGIGTSVPFAFDEAVLRVQEVFKAHGFGTLTQIDVRKTLKEKIDKDIEPYTILGVCNPHLASHAIENEHLIGLLLPCNILVHECGGSVQVAVQDPQLMVDAVGNPALESVAKEAREKLVEP